jgi:hypothetical protein
MTLEFKLILFGLSYFISRNSFRKRNQFFYVNYFVKFRKKLQTGYEMTINYKSCGKNFIIFLV